MSDARKYHHGNLKEAFVQAAREILERDGLNGLSIRKCAQEIGVSHTSLQNHFGNLTGLLTATVTEGYRDLAQMMGQGVDSNSSRKERREKALLGYVRFAENNPALYELMFARNRIVEDQPELLQEVRNCFAILADGAQALGWHEGNEETIGAKGQMAIWSLVHGYAQLVTAGRFKKDSMQGLTILDIMPKVNADKID